jgi:hypothetical protein
MLLDKGAKILIVHRRLFERDKSRYFLGSVDDYESGIVKATGYTWVQDAFSGRFVQKQEVRTKIFSLASGTLFVYELPREFSLSSSRFEYGQNGKAKITDGKNCEIDLSETVHKE